MSRSTDTSWEENVFEQITAPVENVESYVTGGLHPIHLGDLVGNYKILRKLGYGGYSTVWLVQEQHKPGAYFALKVVRADTSCADEVQLYQTLQLSSSRHRGRSHTMMLKDYFTLGGPNGMHDCLIYELLGPSIGSVLSGFDGPYGPCRLTLSSARRVIYQVLLGLEFMHSLDLVHGDLYTDNVLFTLEDLSREPPSAVRQPHSQVSESVRRIKGPSQPGDPRHLTLNSPLNSFVSTVGDVKLADLGNSFPKHNPPKKLETPREYRSPELTLDNYISEAQDCWAFACFIYDVLAGRRLFDLEFTNDRDSQDDIHLLRLYSLLGPLPSQWRSHWPRYSKYFNAENQLQKFTVDDPDPYYDSDFDKPSDDHRPSVSGVIESPETEDQQSPAPSDLSSFGKEAPPDIPVPDLLPFVVTRDKSTVHGYTDKELETLAEFSALYPSLSDRWMSERDPEMQPAEAEMVLDLLQSMLTYDVDQRPSTKQILAHPWIETYCAPENDTSDSIRPLREMPVSSGRGRKRSNAAIEPGSGNGDGISGPRVADESGSAAGETKKRRIQGS